MAPASLTPMQFYIGDDYDEVDSATGGTPVGTTSYTPGPLESEKVYYWRVDEFDGVETHKGDVWAFTTPGAVGNPDPANGAEQRADLDGSRQRGFA